MKGLVEPATSRCPKSGSRKPRLLTWAFGSLKDIEDAIGSTYADMIGTHRGNRLVGLEGSDYLFRNGGPARLDDHWSSRSVASS